MSEPPADVAEPRQRWRLVVARDPDSPEASQRDVAAAWIASMERAGLPLVAAGGTRGRARVSFAAPLPAGMAAERELIDIVLTERWPAWRVRGALSGALPTGWRLIDAFDIWLGGPPVAGRVVAADYRIELAGEPDIAGLSGAASALLDADRLPRERQKGGTTVIYDLRPLLVGVAIDAGPPPTVRTRTRIDPERGAGRPDEVLAALADHADTAVEARSITRERVLLDEDLRDRRLVAID